jgi:Protein of unknown function (DUF3667)
MAAGVDTPVATCASCGERLGGPYCAQCGERVLDPESRTVRHFLTRTVPHELFDVDGKLWRTFRTLLLHPGGLTREYSAGRRTGYLSPLRLLLTSIVLYALATQGGLLITLTIGRLTLSVAPTAVSSDVSIEATVARIDRLNLLKPMLARKRQTVDITSDAARQRFHAALNRFAQPLSFANVLLLSLLLHAVYRRRRALLLDNAAFAMHLVSFVLISSLTLLPVARVMTVSRAIGLVWILAIFLWQAYYMGAAVRAYYFAADRPSSWPRLRAAAAALLLLIVNAAFVTVVQMVGGGIALRGL